MALEDTMRSLREFDISDLDFENVGSWPAPFKVLIWVAALALVLVGLLARRLAIRSRFLDRAFAWPGLVLTAKVCGQRPANWP